MSLRLRRPSHHAQRGVTLVELVITIVLISIAIAGVVGGFSLVVGRSSDTLFQSRTTALGQAYLDEILVKKFSENTGTGGVPQHTGNCDDDASGDTVRETFDVVNDYDVIDKEEPTLVSGSLSGNYDGYDVSVDVNCVSSSEVEVDSANAKRIDVTVNPPQGPTMVFTAYKGNF